MQSTPHKKKQRKQKEVAECSSPPLRAALFLFFSSRCHYHLGGERGIDGERERGNRREQRVCSFGFWSWRSMFFHVKLEKNIVLEPRHFGARMRDVLTEKLKLEVL